MSVDDRGNKNARYPYIFLPCVLAKVVYNRCICEMGVSYERKRDKNS